MPSKRAVVCARTLGSHPREGSPAGVSRCSCDPRPRNPRDFLAAKQPIPYPISVGQQLWWQSSRMPPCPACCFGLVPFAFVPNNPLPRVACSLGVEQPLEDHLVEGRRIVEAVPGVVKVGRSQEADLVEIQQPEPPAPGARGSLHHDTTGVPLGGGDFLLQELLLQGVQVAKTLGRRVPGRVHAGPVVGPARGIGKAKRSGVLGVLRVRQLVYDGHARISNLQEVVQ
mmetsp:Transcript_26318/g.54269  ORF Transcript_26318/g.54269 Transcript_26318/m.54269 type:complete len:227 (-) Transcript_26318:325-1005(-)